MIHGKTYFYLALLSTACLACVTSSHQKIRGSVHSECVTTRPFSDMRKPRHRSASLSVSRESYEHSQQTPSDHRKATRVPEVTDRCDVRGGIWTFGFRWKDTEKAGVSLWASVSWPSRHDSFCEEYAGDLANTQDRGEQPHRLAILQNSSAVSRSTRRRIITPEKCGTARFHNCT